MRFSQHILKNERFFSDILKIFYIYIGKKTGEKGEKDETNFNYFIICVKPKSKVHTRKSASRPSEFFLNFL